MPRIWNRPSAVDLGIFGFAIALSASITITNVMLGILTVLHARSIRRPHPSFFVERTVRRFPTLLTGGLVAVGILAFVHLAGWYFWAGHLRKDPEMRHFLEILQERHMIASMAGSWWDSILSLAWVAPPMSEYSGTPPDTMMALNQNWTTFPAYISGLVVFLLTLCSLRVTPSRAMFIPAFALFGVALHSIYGQGESFLYSANYTWATVIAIGLLGRAIAPRFLGRIALVIAFTLFIVNWAIWKTGVDWIIMNGYILPEP